MSKRQHSNELKYAVVFGGLTVFSGVLFLSGMISNGKGAVELYNKLKAADEAGGDVNQALNELRSYIYSHMNTEIGGENGIYPPIQLSGTYSRLVAAEEQRVKAINDNLYTEAQAFCEANGNRGFSGSNRLDCINGYIDQNGAKPQEIEDAFYKYDFVAPRWSPDLAGFSLIALIIFGLITMASLIAFFRTRHFVHLSK
jgi:hypothetical protein